MFHYLFSILRNRFINMRKTRTAIGCFLFIIGFKPKFGIMGPNELICAGYIMRESDYSYFAVVFPIPMKWALSYYKTKYNETLV